MSSTKSRMHFVDFAKGLAAILMVLGHAEIFFDPLCYFPTLPEPFYAPVGPQINFWIYVLQSSVDAFYFCAGIALGMKAFSASSLWPIRRQLVVKGLQLIAVDLTVISWAYSAPGQFRLYFGSIASFGVSFIIMALLLGARPLLMALLAIALLVVRELLIIPEPLDFETGWQILYGIFWHPVLKEFWVSQFVVICWLPIILLGYCFGYLVRQRPMLANTSSLAFTTLACLVAFAALRAFSLFGSLGQPIPQDLVQFFALSKYPASIQFHLLNMGFCFLYLCLGKIAERFCFNSLFVQMTLLLGRRIFFVYLAHEILFGFCKHFLGISTSVGSLLLALFIFGISMLFLVWLTRIYDHKQLANQPMRNSFAFNKLF